jgi:hypothetical protein
MKRYLLFSSMVYYPFGGWKDYHSDHESLESAKSSFVTIHDRFRESHIVDTATMEIVYRQYEDYEPEDWVAS